MKPAAKTIGATVYISPLKFDITCIVSVYLVQCIIKCTISQSTLSIAVVVLCSLLLQSAQLDRRSLHHFGLSLPGLVSPGLLPVHVNPEPDREVVD